MRGSTWGMSGILPPRRQTGRRLEARLNRSDRKSATTASLFSPSPFVSETGNILDFSAHNRASSAAARPLTPITSNLRSSARWVERSATDIPSRFAGSIIGSSIGSATNVPGGNATGSRRWMSPPHFGRKRMPLRLPLTARTGSKGPLVEFGSRLMTREWVKNTKRTQFEANTDDFTPTAGS